MAAYRGLGGLRKGDSFGVWVVRIADREAVRLGKKRKRGDMAGLDQADMESRAAGNGEVNVEQREVLVAIAGLPVHERAVVTLRYLEGRSVAEVGEITGRPVGTVTKQLSRAIKRLRRVLEAE